MGFLTSAGRRCLPAVVLCLTVVTSATAAAPPSRPGLECPVNPCAIAVLFDRPPAPWAAGHRGIDITAAPGDAVHSPAPGTVVVAEWVVDRPVITVLHVNGLRSSMEPVTATVEVGTVVGAGDVIGVVNGFTHGHDDRVHWGLRDGSNYVNPLDYLVGFGPIRLVPVV